MAIKRLSKDEWLEARQTWEADQTISFEALAERLGVSRPAVSKMAAKQGWVKAGSLDSINRAAHIKADAADIESLDQVTGKVTDEVTGETLKREPLKQSVELSTDLRARIIQSHRAELRKHASLFKLDDINRDFENGKKAKISAEMLAIRHKAERLAWGMDETQAEGKQIVIERSYGR